VEGKAEGLCFRLPIRTRRERDALHHELDDETERPVEPKPPRETVDDDDALGVRATTGPVEVRGAGDAVTDEGKRTVGLAEDERFTA
jgi:hypothetical protein